MKYTCIAIEGIDGSGKTTVGTALAEKLGYKFISKPMSEIIGKEEYKNCVPKLNKNQNELVKSLFYACGNAYSLGLNENIVVDRHLLSNYYHNFGENNKKLFDVLIEILGKPDLTVLLYCKNTIRQKRMIDRNPEDKDIEEVFKFNEVELKKMKDFLNKYKFNYIEIDTTNLTIEETIKKILEELSK
ncbi:AAA family ATPase [Cetobacterium sp.]|uniref:AAA family ATPase n=1 Tax=Cetobacterium sp. TaxID=2071632 RepID=UPI003EE672C8